MKRLAPLALAAALAIAAPAMAAPPPAQLSQSERNDYREVFSLIEAERWAEASAKLDSMQQGPLHAAARTEIYLAKNSPRVELPQILPLLSAAPEAPHAAQLSRLAETRGGTGLPAIVPPQKLMWGGSQPRRARARSIKGDAVAMQLEPLIQPMIVDDQPAAAEALLASREASLGIEARTEFQQRIGWSHYLVGNDEAARALSLKAARSGAGEWVPHAEWTAGLAAWRMHDCKGASESFATVAGRSSDPELIAAGHYWASRAELMCGRPQQVTARLKTAARYKETFYGLLAASALGIKTRNYSELHDYRDAEWRGVLSRPNVKTALALMEVSEPELADEYLRHQAQIAPGDHDAILHLAEEYGLAGLQYWLAHNVPRGGDVNLSARYPMPEWRPKNGWRVEKPLLYAHALQESAFRTHAVSSAGAVGVMQVRPGSAGDIARKRGEPFTPKELTQPSNNIEYGQSYIEYLRDYPATQGLLPKVIAAYNAGPAPVAKWNDRQMDGGDPLLWMESLPYWETRGYVPIVLRNYWIYEQKADRGSASRKALAQGMWPKFPGLPGANAVRVNTPRRPFMPAATPSASASK